MVTGAFQITTKKNNEYRFSWLEKFFYFRIYVFN
jgi:hypothetical protein